MEQTKRETLIKSLDDVEKAVEMIIEQYPTMIALPFDVIMSNQFRVTTTPAAFKLRELIVKVLTKHRQIYRNGEKIRVILSFGGSCLDVDSCGEQPDGIDIVADANHQKDLFGTTLTVKKTKLMRKLDDNITIDFNIITPCFAH